MRFVALITLSVLLGCVFVQAREEPLLEWQFLFHCAPNGQEFTGFFTEVTGILNKNEWECERYTASNGRETTSCLPSQFAPSPLKLRRVLTGDNDEFWDWRDIVANGHLQTARTNCSISLAQRDYTFSLANTWLIYNAWPASVALLPAYTMRSDPDNWWKLLLPQSTAQRNPKDVSNRIFYS
jgi:phage tail-like protein